MGFAIALATGLYGISFGALAVTAGLPVWGACALSLLMFTGGSQFAFVGVIGGGGTGAAALAAASLLGVRNAIYGVELSALLCPGRAERFAMAHLTIDESTATATAQDAPDEQRRGFWAAGLGVFLCWNLATVAGALLGERVGNPAAFGLDGAATAAFLGLLWPRLRGRDPIALAVVCAVVTIAAVPFVPPGIPIIIAAAVAVAVSVHQRRGQA